MTIKPETDDRGALCLGTLIYHTESGLLDIRYLNKNETSLATTGHQKILRFQHIASYTATPQKMGTIIGEITRILRLTTRWSDVLAQIELLLSELLTLGYTLTMIKRIVMGKFNKTGDSKWTRIYQHLHTLA